jgi:apolipoprotein D and lipocalin family protein
MKVKSVLAGFVLLTLSLFGCTGVPKGLKPITGFQPNRYLGKWYEIARLDHSFERNLTNVSAYYSEREDGGITVVNRGFNEKSKEWKRVEGRGYFIRGESVGSLKISFFGPFYGGYHIIALDKEKYGYSMVAGPSRSFLWILCREKSLDSKILEDLVSKAKQWGFDTESLIYVRHDLPDE